MTDFCTHKLNFLGSSASAICVVLVGRSMCLAKSMGNDGDEKPTFRLHATHINLMFQLLQNHLEFHYIECVSVWLDIFAHIFTSNTMTIGLVDLKQLTEYRQI